MYRDQSQSGSVINSDLSDCDGSFDETDLGEPSPTKDKKQMEAYDRNPDLNMENMQKHDQLWLNRTASESLNHKVDQFILKNPVSAAFLRREKGRLPYSVFKATATEIKFIKSEFKGRPPTAFFSYPTYV